MERETMKYEKGEKVSAHIGTHYGTVTIENVKLLND